jgi:filamentous hemagglutinin
VQSPITDMSGNPILVSKRVDLKTCKPQAGSPLQEAVPDAVSFERKHIIDDKPLGRPIAKDRQEIIRFIKAYEQREGQLPKVIGITRYDPQTGQQVLTELYSPKDFLP